MVALLASFAGLSSCAFVTTSKGPHSFVSTSDHSAAYITWTENPDHDLNGTLQYSEPEVNTAQGLVKATTLQVLGSRSGSDVSLRLNNGLTMTGTLDDGDLELRVPSDQGGIQTWTFRPGSANAYNRAVSALKEVIQGDRDRDRAASELASDQQQLNRSRVVLSSLTSDLHVAIAGLPGSVEDVNAALNDQVTALQDATRSDCIDLNTAVDDEEVALADVGVAGDDFETAVDDLRQVASDLQTKIADVNQLVDEIAVRTDTRPSVPEIAAAMQELSKARSAPAGARATVQQYLDHAAGFDRQAESLRGKAC